MRALILALLLPVPALAGEAVVTEIAAARTGETWRFDVTVAHADEGWDHYADAWRVEAENGTELGLRILHHPHVEEQPFTRSLSGVAIPDGTGTVIVRARDSVHGWGDGVPYALPR
ncbi:hypothetical protein JQC91_14055 [Jannaschia sp. Os4]|uniref:hypothetical protein n=1 Tax=Jannaschia sp. Os4 TaxID=2807617 RepID=UPI00193A4169|nr:hypothetical protein [Jannaschia sp. Os4]MBM2577427.1 hypothetical protein [Jannaschia sp. Os4]